MYESVKLFRFIPLKRVVGRGKCKERKTVNKKSNNQLFFDFRIKIKLSDTQTKETLNYVPSIHTSSIKLTFTLAVAAN